MAEMEAEIPVEDTPAAPPPATARWVVYARRAAYVAVVVIVSLLAGGDLPRSQTYASLMEDLRGSMRAAATNPGQLQDAWKPVGNYVVEQSLTEAMTGVERLQHEAEQRALLAPKEVPPPPTIRIPLLPGPVQKTQPAAPAANLQPAASGAAALAPLAPVTEVPAAAPAPAAAKQKPDPFAEDIETLEALQRALRELKAEGATSFGTYRDDVADN